MQHINSDSWETFDHTAISQKCHRNPCQSIAWETSVQIKYDASRSFLSTIKKLFISKILPSQNREHSFWLLNSKGFFSAVLGSYVYVTSDIPMTDNKILATFTDDTGILSTNKDLIKAFNNLQIRLNLVQAPWINVKLKATVINHHTYDTWREILRVIHILKIYLENARKS